jgi:hypothetical protein
MVLSNEERLTRLETPAETTLLAIQQLAIQQRDTQAQLTNSIQDLVNMITQLAKEAAEDRKIIQEIQTEVRGLQIENRRILDRLDQHLSDGHRG